ncbi:MAG TPA: PP2C family protein-serine/threonine phosphatase [Vicinamibacterales bacterium]|nr:PP2C family protein-serine/threonine phosphatase [Vicinamibacterales bacterium]
MPREFISRYTHDLTSDDLGKLFTRETPEAYRFFARGINTAELEGLPWHRKAIRYAQGFFLAFTMRLSPARRLMYGVALGASVIGLLELFNGFGLMRVPIAPFIRVFVPAPLFSDGTLWLLSGFLLMNLLVLLEVADRLSLKRDLEVAREIQQAMLPEGTWSGPGVEAFGLTKPANTVGGDFYDILPRPDGTVMVALGDVAGKASPAALLMALLLAMLRTLVDEELPLPVLVQRLNLQVARHAPSSRFITLFLSSFDPATGRLQFVNAGQTPPLLRRQNGSIERLLSGGVALGMFAGSTYEAGEVQLNPGDALLLYSDGITEAESPDGQPFDEAGLERTLALYAGAYQKSAAAELGRAIFDAVERHRRDQRLADDLTVLVLSRLAVV